MDSPEHLDPPKLSRVPSFLVRTNFSEQSSCLLTLCCPSPPQKINPEGVWRVAQCHECCCQPHPFTSLYCSWTLTGLGLSGQALTFAERANLKREESTVVFGLQGPVPPWSVRAKKQVGRASDPNLQWMFLHLKIVPGWSTPLVQTGKGMSPVHFSHSFRWSLWGSRTVSRVLPVPSFLRESWDHQGVYYIYLYIYILHFNVFHSWNTECFIFI